MACDLRLVPVAVAVACGLWLVAVAWAVAVACGLWLVACAGCLWLVACG